MATENKKAKPAAKPVPKKGTLRTAAKKGKPRVSFASIGRFFRDVIGELKKVSWPSRKEFITYTVAVVVFVTLAGFVIFAMDNLIGTSVMRLLNTIGS